MFGKLKRKGHRHKLHKMKGRGHGHGFSHREMGDPGKMHMGRRGAYPLDRPVDAGSAAVGGDVCPMCENHCLLSDPGCEKGAAYSASRNPV